MNAFESVIIIIIVISALHELGLLGLILVISVVIYICYYIYKLYLEAYVEAYFKSEEFLKIKDSIKNHTKNCNELNNHIEDLKSSYIDVKSYDYGASNLQDASNYNFKRKKWKEISKNRQVHNCSATVCKNANDQPFKYLCKYFDIKINEDTLSNFENVLNDFAAAEQGKILLQKERDSILLSIKNDIPLLIYKLAKNRIATELGFETIDFSDLYFPVYTFQYVSAGGNSSSKCDIKLNIQNLDRFVMYLNELVKFKQSIKGQRALMTSWLRETIKKRDNFACKICGISTNDEKNLLLEIDHIIPLSKGGITSENNLQTLCWRCNRSKGSKIA